jgi:hypothetical protein
VSRIPEATARAIDRLARGAHAFHRFAHHPLCDEYASEVVRIGRRARLCRGCSLAALGAFSGAILGASIAVPTAVAAGAAAAAFALCSKPVRGAGKFLSRFLPAGCAALAFASGLRSASLAGFVVAGGAAVSVLLFVARYRRRGPDRRPCATCPERERPVPCRGFAAIVRRERAFSRLASSRFGT